MCESARLDKRSAPRGPYPCPTRRRCRVTHGLVALLQVAEDPGARPESGPRPGRRASSRAEPARQRPARPRRRRGSGRPRWRRSGTASRHPTSRRGAARQATGRPAGGQGRQAIPGRRESSSIWVASGPRAWPTANRSSMVRLQPHQLVDIEGDLRTVEGLHERGSFSRPKQVQTALDLHQHCDGRE